MSNEAAERLLTAMAYEVDPAGYFPGDWFDYHKEQLNAALAAERRATVERIRAALIEQGFRVEYGWGDLESALDRILDAEAAP